MTMREKYIEAKLVRTVKAAGGMAPKFVSPGLDGMPDRLVLLPDCKAAFVEVKAPGEKPRPLQLKGTGNFEHLALWSSFLMTWRE